VVGRIRASTDLAAGVGDADLVVEAVPERLDLKRAVFAEFDRLCPPRTVLATNSSSIRVSQIEDATGQPDRVLNAHFYPPVWERPMVELMRGSATSDETEGRVRRFARSIGMTPLLVRKESTGFLFNVEPHHVRHAERSDRHPPADHPGSVDVVDGSDPLVDQVERLPFDRRPDPVVLDIEEV
jgi:3-hydroxyacyl-CoA dehydrogenase, NAD binding domain